MEAANAKRALRLKHRQRDIKEKTRKALLYKIKPTNFKRMMLSGEDTLFNLNLAFKHRF
jgi:hypothetical protein